MKLQEFAAKQLLVQAGLPVPDWSVASTPAEARAQAEAYLAAGAGKVVIKAQVLVGGRGKAGGVKLAATADEAEAVAAAILGMDIKGITVRRVLVAAAADIVKEFYLAAVLDRGASRHPHHGLGRGRRGDRDGRRDRPRCDRLGARAPPPRALGPPGAPDRVRDGPR